MSHATTVNGPAWIFKGAGIYGVLVLFPCYFCEGLIGRLVPPELNHPEMFYGLVGVGLAWQIAFIIMGTDPVRYRPLMPAAMLEKFSYVGALTVLYAKGRVPALLLGPGLGDLILGLLFVHAWIKTGSAGAKALA